MLRRALTFATCCLVAFAPPPPPHSTTHRDEAIKQHQRMTQYVKPVAVEAGGAPKKRKVRRQSVSANAYEAADDDF